MLKITMKGIKLNMGFILRIRLIMIIICLGFSKSIISQIFKNEIGIYREGQTDTILKLTKETILKHGIIMPKYPGGELAFRKFIERNVIYPNEARENDIQGRVYVRFAVTPEGNIEKVSIARGVHPIIDEEAARVVKSSPKWAPGEMDGKKMNVWFTVPINFSLAGSANYSKTKSNFSVNSKAISSGKATDIKKSYLPKYKGGFKNYLKFIEKRMKYPKSLRKNSIKGFVYVKFHVNRDGSINDLKIVKSLHPLLDKEALRVIKLTSGKWIIQQNEKGKAREWNTTHVEF